jgi:hypothetical protein
VILPLASLREQQFPVKPYTELPFAAFPAKEYLQSSGAETDEAATTAGRTKTERKES